MPELLFHLGMPRTVTSVPHHASIFDIVLIVEVLSHKTDDTKKACIKFMPHL